MDEHTSVALIHALARVWTAIRHKHPEVPGVVLLPAPSLTRKMNVLGHFAPLRWKPRKKKGQLVHEVVVVAEHLDRKVTDIVETLLHEAAHALNHERGVNDCSASQYHNRKFKAAAEELGLVVEQVPHYGFAYTTLPPETAELYALETKALEVVLVRRAKPFQIPKTPGTTGDDKKGGDEGGEKKPRSRNRKATCACGFIIRVSKKTMEDTVIRCESCGEPFNLV